MSLSLYYKTFQNVYCLKKPELSWLHSGSHPTLEKLKIIFVVKFISEEIKKKEIYRLKPLCGTVKKV